MTTQLWLIRLAPNKGTTKRVSAIVAAATIAIWCCTVTPANAEKSAQPSDFNGDGFADLAVGVPGEQLGQLPSAGGVQVIYGAPGGLRAAGSQFWTQSSPGIKGRADYGGAWGTTHTSGDFDADGYADLAVGSPRCSAACPCCTAAPPD